MTDEKIKAVIGEEIRRPFDLAVGPLLRASLCRVAESKWLFVYVMHHIISDEWSMRVLINELFLLYNANIQQAGDPLPPIRIQYKDYSAWQNSQLHDGLLEAHKAWWLKQFEGDIPLLNMPGDRIRPLTKSYEGSVIVRKIDVRLAMGIKSISQQLGGTLFMGLLAVVKGLLYRYTHQKDIIVGTPMAGRENADLEDQIGFYVNTLAVRTEISVEDSYSDLVGKIKRVTIDAYKYQAYPFEELVNDLNLQRDMSRNPLFDVMVLLQNEGIFNRKEYDNAVGLKIKKYGGDKQAGSKFDLLFSFADTEDGLESGIEYNSDIYDKGTIERLASHLEQLMGLIIQDPLKPIREFDYLSDEEKNRLLATFNETAKTYPEHKTIVDLFEDQAERTPDNVAVVDGSSLITYRELNEISNQLANYLRSHYPIHPDDIVGIKMERGMYYIIAVLGVLKSCAAYMPLDPNYPENRTSFMERDSKCLVTIDPAYFEEFLQQRKGYPAHVVSEKADPDNLVYLIYTSGSTGQPKGIMMRHAAMVNLMHFHLDTFPGEEMQSVLQFAGISFDVSFQEIFSALTRGAALYPIPDEIKKGTTELVDFIIENKISAIFLPTAYCRLLMEEEYFLTHIGSTVKHIIVAGEQLILSEPAIHFLKTGAVKLHNHYGPAETHVISTCTLGQEGPDQIKRIPSIGKPINNSQIYILDDSQLLMPVGAAGEIYIGGAGLAKGYLNQETLTKDKFISNPFRQDFRIYRTGDLGRWLPDGSIEFLGRKDDQVKIHGFRIEPGEIESTLQNHPKIDSAAVIISTDEKGEKNIIAYVVSDEKMNAYDVRNYLGRSLPAYMLPHFFVQLERLPLTPNGKLDRKSLPYPSGSEFSAAREYVAPRNAVEEELVKIWSDVLGTNRGKISVKDDFFESGGHSLKVTRLISQLRKRFEVKIAIKDLFATTVLEAQAQLICQAQRSQFIAIIPIAGLPSYPLSSSQRRLWVLSQLEQGNIAYNMPGAYVFEGELDIASLEYAFTTLIERHEILRTIFKEDETGEIRQYIRPPDNAGFGIIVQDVREEEDEIITRRVLEQFLKPFDLSADLLLRACLFRSGDKKWIFSVVTHHIVVDGWSMDILIRELLLLYKAHVNKEPYSLTPLRIQYKDYAWWQQDQLKKDVFKEHKAWWLQQFEGEIPILELPADKVRPAIMTYNGATVDSILAAATCKGIKELCQDQQATLFMGLLAIVNVLLYKYSGQNDIIIGSPIAGREHADLEDQIGFYINTLPLRTRFDGQDNFKELLENIKQFTIQAYEHERYPFDELVDELKLRRDMSRNPLFDVSLSLLNAEDIKANSQTPGQLEIHKYEDAARITSRFDLLFIFLHEDDTLRVRIEFNSDIYGQATMERLADHLLQISEAIVLHPGRPVSQLEILSQVEREQLLYEFNDTTLEYPPGKTLVQLFNEQVARTPGKTALVFGQTSLTYQELDIQSSRLADHLRRTFGARPDMLIGLILDRSDMMIIAIAGILKSGAAYVPIDPAYPLSRKEFVCRDAAINILITQTDYLFELDFYKGDIFSIDVELDLVDTSVALPAITIGPDDLAYVIYTSGSTGQPKGVMIEHAAIANTIQSQQSIFNVHEDYRHLQFASSSFDASVSEIFVALLSGGTLYIINEADKKDPFLFTSFIKENKIDIATIPPAFLQLMEIDQVQPLKRLITAGEAAIKNKVADFTQYGDYYNAYGPTESAICASVFKVAKGKEIEYSIVPIGRPICNTQIYIVNKDLGLMPVGLPGEICIGGAGLARGYLNLPGLTADRFIENPFVPSERMYRTGDWGKWLPDGNIEFTGRMDNQVKVHGYRIELGEIEQIVIQLDFIKEVVAAVREDKTGKKDLIIYYVQKEPAFNEMWVLKEKVKDALTEKLPLYMVPNHIVQLDELPLTVNGKIDKQRLPDPAALDLATGVEYVAARNEAEQQLALIWQEVLNKEKISMKDDFFDLGGHSLKATRLASQIEKTFEVKVALKDLLTITVLEEQAKLILKAPKKSFISILPAPLQPHYPLSSAQYRLWILSQFEEANVAYNMPGVFVFEGDIDIVALEQAFTRVIERHESLRTVFKNDEQGQIRQFVLSAGETGFTIVRQDLHHRDDGERVVQQLMQEEIRKPFDLATGPLVRAALFKLTADKSIFTYVMHHIVCDGWSIGILLDELLLFYNTFTKGSLTDLPPLRIQYKDFSVWQQQQLQDEVLADDKTWWLQQFEGKLPVLELAGDKIRPAVKSYNGGVVNKTINAGSTKKIKAISQEQGGTLFMGLLAAVYALLHRYTNHEDIIIGTPVAARNHTDLENQIGFYVNTLALRVCFQGENSFRELFDNVKQKSLHAFEHQLYPLDKLVDDLQLRRDISRNPLFDVTVVLQNNAGSGVEMKDKVNFRVSTYEEEVAQISKFDLSFNFSETGEEIQFNIIYNSDIYNKRTVHRMADHFVQLMDRMLTYPDLPFARLDYLSLSEKQQLLESFNDPVTGYPADKTIIALFEEQVAMTPDHVALSFEGIRMSYKELNGKANQLGNYLRGHYRIQTDELVGIKLDRSEWMIIAILGVLKSGGAYVPIDPEYPQERIDYIISDSQCRVMIDQDEINRFRENEAAFGDENPEPVNSPHDLAYVIYTSGTTGRPKGTLIEHKNIVRLFKTGKPLFDFDDRDIWTLFHSYCFDFSVWEMFGALLFGGKLVIIPSMTARDPLAFLQLLIREGVTVLNQTPSSFYNVIKKDSEASPAAMRLRYAIFGGEALSPGKLHNWRKRYPGTKLINMYGITETTVHVTYKEIGEEEIGKNISNIGRPIPTLSCYVLDKNRNLVPVGVPGEMYVGGEGVARGYLNRAELTAERFIASPFRPGERLYRSGDLVKILESGELEYIGRTDEQVKIRGYRIELSEVERALESNPDVSSAVVLAKANGEGGMELVAYLTAKEALSVADLRYNLGRLLPAYMLPSHYVQMDSLPLTPNGKVDKRSLPEPAAIGMDTGVRYVAPQNTTEEKCVEVWQEVLGKSNIGVRDNFFELGGDSIKVLRMLALLRKVTNLDISISDIYKNNTIATLLTGIAGKNGMPGQQIKEQGQNEAIVLHELNELKGRILSSPHCTDAENIEDVYPMSDIEKGMVFESLLNEGLGIYHDQMSNYRVFSGFSIQHFTLALELLAAKHPILRTAFNLNDFETEVQIIYKKISLPVDYADLSGKAAKDQEDIVQDYIKEECKRPFTFSVPPLWRMRIYYLGDSHYLFVFQCHHSIIDGWSYSLFMTELNNLYLQLLEQPSHRPDNLKASYKDFIVRHIAVKKNEAVNIFWRKELSDYKRSDLFTGEMVFSDYAQSMAGSYLDKLRKVAASLNTTVKALSLGVYLYMLKILQFDSEIVTGLVTNTRPDCEDGDKILGCFLNMIPFRILLSEYETWHDLFAGIDAKLIALKENEQLSLPEIARLHGIQRDSQNPFFDIFFNYVDFYAFDALRGDERLKENNNLLQPFAVPNLVRNNMPLDVSVNVSGGRFTVNISMGRKLKSGFTPGQLSAFYFNILNSLIESPYQSLRQAEYLGATGKNRLLIKYNDTEAAYSKNKTMTDLFEKQVSLSPDSIALVYGEKRISYRQLNENANLLASYLRSCYSIRPEDLVGIQLHRSDRMITAILAVLKSGAAYVPIDPAYPKDRIAYIIGDSRCRLVIDEQELNKFDLRKEQSGYDKENPGPVNKPDDLAYVIYTSGSTGMPKGCGITHRNLNNYIEWANRYYFGGLFTPNFGLYTSLSFDLTVTSIFCCLTQGGELFIYEQDSEITDILRHSFTGESKINCIKLTPSHLNIVRTLPIRSSAILCVIMGGEQVTAEHVRLLKRINHSMNIYNEYGPTEATVGCIVSKLEENEPVLIGRPISNTQVYIVNDTGGLSPEGVVGELCIGGDGLARGYVNKPDLTNERFVINPFRNGERLYKTGDLARLLPEGDIEFLGRKDEQVKVRGYRIEPGEIEAALEGHPDVDHAAIKVVVSPEGGNELVAYLVSKKALHATEVRRYLSEILPGHMVPGQFVQLEELPLTGNGKLDKRRLPDPIGIVMTSGTRYVAPGNGTEQKLVLIWQEILGRNVISVKDNFFELGGHSIRVTRLASQIHKIFDVKITLKELFAKPILEEQAALISPAGKVAFTGIAPLEEQPHYPLSSAQRRLWILSQFSDANIAYNRPGAYIFEGELDPATLQYAFDRLIERHESLRTVFREDENGEIRQFIRPPEATGFKIMCWDLRQEKEEAVASSVQDEFQRPFDLAAGPLLRATLFQVQDEKWVFTYVIHHIISDGWSMSILIDELLQLYNARRRGEANPLKPLHIQYRDYAAWQKEQLSGTTLQEHKVWWLKELEGELPVLELPADGPRPIVKTYHGDVISKIIDPDTGRQLQAIIRQQGCTLFMGLLAAVNTLLYRYTGQKDIIIGSPIAGRDHADLADQIGFYVNTLVLRTRFNGTDSYKDLLDGIKRTTIGAYEHQLYPFDELVDELQLRRDRSRNPLFDIQVVVENADNYGRIINQGLGGLNVHEYHAAKKLTSVFDMVFNFSESESGLGLHITYNSDIYGRQLVEQMAGHLEQLMEAIIKYPDRPIDELNFLSEKDLHRLLIRFNDTAVAYPAGQTLVSLFEDQARQRPDEVAVVFSDRALSYDALKEQSDRLAAYLVKDCHIDREELIGIMVDRSEKMIVSILGILKAGGAYVPIDPQYPQARKEFIIRDTEIRILITQSDYMFDLEYYEGDIFAIDIQMDGIEADDVVLQKVIEPSQLAYVIYTSGSTGMPKGVMIEHGAIVNTILAQRATFEVQAGERNLQFASCSFDASVSEIFVSLASGGALYIIEETAKKDPSLLQHYIRDHKIDIGTIPPAYLKLLETEQLRGMKKLITAGEAALYDKAVEFCKLGIYYNAYGPTETSICATVYKVDRGGQIATGSVPIGAPIANTEVYIVDGGNKLQPTGVIGEICISGKGLARGYLNQPEMTAEKFVSNPFREGERMYKTGDLGKWLPDGNILFTGRKDEQVKIRGYRIETGEVEHALLSHGMIDSAVVMARPNGGGEMELVAYLVGGVSMSTADLRSHLQTILPDYMLPSHWVQLDTWPVTANGKIDRSKLPDPANEGADKGAEYIAPRNETEEQLAVIWQKVLGREKIGIKDDFFMLGGHSLKATKLAGMIQKEFEKDISLKDLFSCTVLEEQAHLIQQAPALPFVGITPTPPQSHYPLSSSQYRLWVLSQLEEGSVAYNMSGAHVFEGLLDRDALTAAFRALIVRHEVLRTVFREDGDGEPRQFILSPEDIECNIDCVDVRGNEYIIGELAQHEFVKPFNLSAGPLVRACLYQAGEDKWVFLYVLHHIISDGWSMDILMKELLLLYNGYVRKEVPVLPPLRIQYKDYAAWQQAQLTGASLRAHREYWLEQFSGELPVLDLPGDKPRPAIKTYNGDIEIRYIAPGLAAEMEALMQQEGATLFMGLLATVKLLLYIYTGQKDLIVGSPIAGREHADLDNQIGFYVNTLPLRSQFDAQNNFKGLLAQVKQVSLEAFAHQAYPFDRLVNELHLRRDMSRNALFDVLMVLQHTQGGNMKQQLLQDVSVSGYEGGAPLLRKFDLAFNFIRTDEELQIVIEFNTDIYHRDTIVRMTNHLAQLMKAVTEQPTIPIGQLNCLDEDEKEQLTVGFNNTIFPYPADRTIIDLFEKQVEITPRAIALVFGETSMTYDELNKQSNRLGAYLRKNYAIERDDLVCLRLRRSEWMVIAILGVLKSGGAYVPIDPGYPAERIAYMVADSQCKLVIDDHELEQFIATASEYTGDNIQPVTRPEDLAYVIYTSGTTGNPKGVMIEHRNLTARMSYLREYYHLTAADNLLFYRSYSFDAAIEEYLLPVIIGARCIIAPDDFKEDLIGNLTRMVALNGITKVNMPPVLLGELLREIDAGILQQLSSLKHVISGGDKLTSRITNDFLSMVPAKLYNAYGPTENTDDSTNWVAEKLADDAPVPIGRPVPNSQVYILNEDLKLLPVGVAGEICVSGAGLARGYLNRPDLTAEKFIDNPFGNGGRMYKTGDRGRWLPDGNIVFMGRKDDQVKIRGYRIEVREIEAALLRHTAVTAAVVICREIANGEKSLVAYLVSGETPDAAGLRIWLGQTLPAYMLPGYFVRLKAIPVNSNGKVDKKALPDPEGVEMGTGNVLVAPRNEQERQLVNVCEDVLKRRPISMQDDFFELGGDSIKSIQIVSRLKQRGYTLGIRDILQYPILKELAGRISIGHRMADQATVQGAIPLSPVQMSLFEQDPTGIHHYNQSVLLHCKQRLSEHGLRLVLDKIVLHHDVLRMVYRRSAEGWIQENKGAGQSYALEILDIESPTEMTLHCDRIQSGIDLANGPLFKAALFHNHEGDRLLLVAHHLVVDGVSWRILLEDLSALYQQFLLQQPLTLPLKTDSFRYWQQKQWEYAASDALLKEEKYWSGIESLYVKPLPLDNPDESNLVKDESFGAFTLDKRLTEKLMTGCHKAYGTEINDILVAALCLTLAEVFLCKDTLIHLEGHGRESLGADTDITRTVGWFTTIFPVFVDLRDSGDPIRQLVAAKESLHRVPNKGIGYGILRYMAEKGYRRSPEITFNYLGDFGAGFDREGREDIFNFSGHYRGAERSGNMQRDGLLSVSGLIANGNLQLSVTYSNKQFTPDTMERLMQAYKAHLSGLIGLLSAEETIHLSPVDLTYKDLTVQQVEALSKIYHIEDVYPLSPLQEGLYYHWVSNPASPAYFEQVSYRLKGRFSVPVLEESYRVLVARHGILRTIFTNDFSDLPLQIVKKDTDASFRFIESAGNFPDLAIGYKQTDRVEGFDLFSRPPVRLTVFGLGDHTYEFIWSHHHILMDGWCGSILIREYFQIYYSLLQDATPQLGKVYPYANYIQWLSQRDAGSSLQYWDDNLSGYDAVNYLPRANAGANKEYDAAELTFSIDECLRREIRNICVETGVTENTFIQAIWGILLSRYNNTDDVVFGSVVSGRPPELQGVEDMIGLFINTIPVRIRLRKNMTIRELLREVQQSSIASMDHHYTQLAELPSASRLQRNLFDHILVFENYPVREMVQQSLAGRDKMEEFTVLSTEVFEQSHYDFSVMIAPGDVITIRFNYNANAFTAEEIGRIKCHLTNLIGQVLKNRESFLYEADFLGPDEKQQLLEEFNDTAMDFPRYATLVEQFEEQANTNPGNIALVFEETVLTYQELNERANQLGHYLRKKYRVKQNDLIGIRLSRGEWAIIAILGVLKSGAAYVPIDPAYPRERIDYIISDSGCRLVLDELELMHFKKEQQEYGKGRPEPIAGPGDLAYVIYTSGSTGKPKGVLIEHATIINTICAQQVVYDVKDGARNLQFSSLSFDASVSEIFVALGSGTALYIVPEEARQNPQLFEEYITTHKISVATLPPAFLKLLQTDRIRSLRVLITAGEPAIAEKAIAFSESGTYINAYGPTEASIHATAFKLDKEWNRKGSNLPIGKPIPNTQLYIVDQYMNLMPIGAIGEICIGGAGVGRGYRNNPELTAQKFVPDRFRKGAFLYKSGDLGRWLADGNVEFLGRKDEQVKIHGYRIESGEIESALQSHPEIVSAVVTAMEDTAGDRYLVAYLTGTVELQSSKIRSWLSNTLPEHMLPAHYIQLKELPFTTSGKIDKKRLPAPEGHSMEAGGIFVAPRYAIEEELIQVWQQVLGKEKIGIEDNFFEAGGNSIRIIRLSKLVSGVVGRSISIAMLFQYANIKDLVDYLINESVVYIEEPVSREEMMEDLNKFNFN